MTEDLLKRGKDKHDPFGQILLSMDRAGEGNLAFPLLGQTIEDGMLGQLNLIRSLELVSFSDFTNAQSEQFKKGFSETVRYLEGKLLSLMAK